LIDQVIAAPPRQREDREGRIFVRAGHEHAAIHDEKMRTLQLWPCWFTTDAFADYHAGRAHFMDNFAAGADRLLPVGLAAK